ncbi:MAG: DUF1444 family protein [Deltaproteobacteria bacterium]|nr:DUF1444 family protein [Deltaproteobacteria bacterium]
MRALAVVVILAAAAFALLPKSKPLESTELDAARFTAIAADMVREALPNATVTVTGELELSVVVGGQWRKFFLDNAWAESKDDPAKRKTAIEDRIAALAGTSEVKPSRETVIPMIKDDIYVRGANERMAARGGKLSGERLAADLWIVYAIDQPKGIAYVSDKELAALAVPAAELRALAIANLRRVLPKIERHGEAAYMLTAGGSFEASLLLLDDVWDNAAKGIEGELVAAVPTRDVILYTGTQSEAGMASMRASMQRLSGDSVSYPVSQQWLVRRGGKWEPYLVRFQR